MKFKDHAAQAGFDFDEPPEELITPDFNKNHNYDGPVCVDIFAGCGGASCGLEQAGIHPAVVVEWDKWCMLTYMANLGMDKNKPVTFLRKDITTITGADIIDCLLNMGYKPEVDHLWGSPPCQDWSSANSKRGELEFSLYAGRRYCMLEYVRLVAELRPKTIAMENVKGLVNKTYRPLFEQFCSKLRNLGYEIQWQVLNAADFGVPQKRERVILTGVERYQLLEWEPWTIPPPLTFEKFKKDYLVPEIAF